MEKLTTPTLIIDFKPELSNHVSFEYDYFISIGQVITFNDLGTFEVTKCNPLNNGSYRIEADDRFSLKNRFGNEED